MFEWTIGNAYTMSVTLYPNNFTLNSVACTKFKDCRYCMLGLDREHKNVAIKIVTKEDVDLGIVPIEHLHKVSLGKGYARISNKPFMHEIAEFMNFDLCKEGIKFPASFSEKDHMLVIDLERRG